MRAIIIKIPKMRRKSDMKKRLIAIGGSIMKGTYTAPGEKSPSSIAHPNFAELFAEAFGYDEYIISKVKERREFNLYP